MISQNKPTWSDGPQTRPGCILNSSRPGPVLCIFSQILKCLLVTLAELGLDYVDCWMVHAPWAFVPLEDEVISCRPREDKFGAMVEEVDILDTWREMEKCVELGLCKSIAVSNFNSCRFRMLMKIVI